MAQNLSQDSGIIQGLFASIAKRYDLANHLLSGGLDFFWRRVTAKCVRKENPGSILDVACGSGDLTRVLKKYCPDAVVCGADFCLPMLLEAERKGIPNLIQADALNLPFADHSFDAVTVAFGLRNMESWSAALREMKRVIKPGGHLYVLDFSIPGFPLKGIYRFYLHHCLPGIAGWITGQRGAYEYLGRSIEEFPQGKKMEMFFCENGFSEASSRGLTGGIVSLYIGRA